MLIQIVEILNKNSFYIPEKIKEKKHELVKIQKILFFMFKWWFKLFYRPIFVHLLLKNSFFFIIKL